MFCGKCGTENQGGITFCIKCGADLRRQSPLPGTDSTSHLKTSPKPGDSVGDIGTSVNPGAEVEDLEIGHIFTDRYEILSEGKRGGMGVVYKCRDRKLNRTIALKVIHPRLLSSEQAIQRFRQEVSISLELLHEKIVRAYNLEEYQGIEFFTMEWVEGKSLRDLIVEKKKDRRPFTLEETYRIISQLTDALEYAHQHTVHRDIKPENILISEGKEGAQVKLTDFGIAKMLTPAQFTTTSLQMGTPYYMAPEQKTDSAHVDKRVDIYAVGVVLFELLTLENTIGPDLPTELNKDLPKEIDSIYRKAVATKPASRYGAINELAESLWDVVRKERKNLEEERKHAEEAKKQEEERLGRQAEEAERKRREDEKRKREEQEKRRKIESLLDEGKVLLKTFGEIIQLDKGDGEARELSERAGSEERSEELKNQEGEQKGKAVNLKYISNWTDPLATMEFVFVKGADFQMGDTFGDGLEHEKPVHEVVVSDFWMGKFPVTQDQWEKLMGNNPCHFKEGGNYPVENVSWNEVQWFIRKLNQKTGKNYRLPTEAEWEYAARSGGKREKWGWTTDEAEVGGYAWYGNNSRGSTHPVGQKKRNGLGLYDMSGNVWEWCQDWYERNYYKGSPKDNPKGPPSGEYRVLRGGSWRSTPSDVRSSHRGLYEPTERAEDLGFRLVLSSR